jgi:ATP-binding cassette subfamily C (CFTR/MRP) protein 1
VQVYPGFVVALVASTILTAFYGILLVLSLFTRGAALEAASLVLQCAAHPLALRLYWLAAPALTALLAGTTIARLASGSGTMRSRWWC